MVICSTMPARSCCQSVAGWVSNSSSYCSRSMIELILSKYPLHQSVDSVVAKLIHCKMSIKFFVLLFMFIELMFSKYPFHRPVERTIGINILILWSMSGHTLNIYPPSSIPHSTITVGTIAMGNSISRVFDFQRILEVGKSRWLEIPDGWSYIIGAGHSPSVVILPISLRRRMRGIYSIMQIACSYYPLAQHWNSCHQSGLIGWKSGGLWAIESKTRYSRGAAHLLLLQRNSHKIPVFGEGLWWLLRRESLQMFLSWRDRQFSPTRPLQHPFIGASLCQSSATFVSIQAQAWGRLHQPSLIQMSLSRSFTLPAPPPPCASGLAQSLSSSGSGKMILVKVHPQNTPTSAHHPLQNWMSSHLYFNTSASARTTSPTLPHPNVLISLARFPRPSPHTSQPPHSLSSSGSGKMTTSKVPLWNALTLACHPLQNRVHHPRLNTSANVRTTLPTLPYPNVLVSLARSPRPFPHTSWPSHSLSSSRSGKMSMSKVPLQNALTLACHPLQNRVHHHPQLNTSANTRMTLPALPHPNTLFLLTCSPGSYPLAWLLP